MLRNALRAKRFSVADEDQAYAYLIMGQSNADGARVIADIPEGYTGPLTGAYVLNHNTGEFEVLEGGVNNQYPAHTLWGPELSFGKSMTETLGRNVYIVKKSLSGSYLAPQTGGLSDWWPDNENELYDQAAELVADARAADVGDKTITFRAVIWAQGEADSATPELDDEYAENLRYFLERVRNDMIGDPVCPVLIMRINNTTYGSTDTRAAQTTISGESSLNYLINIDDLELNADNVHFSAQGYIDFGNKLAETAATL